MVVTCGKCGTKYTLSPKQPGAQTKGKFRCAKCGETTMVDLGSQTATVGAPGGAPPVQPASPKPDFDRTQVNEFSGLALPKDRTITISGIGGPAKGIKHAMTKPRVTVGRLGGGADIQLDDPEISRKHCKVEVKEDVVKLHDLKSTNGTFVNDEQIQQCELEHLSEFRVGSSLLLVTIMHKQD